MLYLFTLGRWQRIEHLRRQYLAVAARRERQAHWRAQQGDAFLFGTALQLAKTLVAASSELLLDDIAPRPVVIALEGRRQGDAQFLNEPFHPIAQPDGAPGRQLQATGFLRVDEVVDVTPVGRRRHARRPAPQEVLYDRVFAGATGAESINIIAFAPHRDAELRRLDRAILADRPRRVRELADQLEPQLAGIAGPVEERRRKRLPRHAAGCSDPVRSHSGQSSIFRRRHSTMLSPPKGRLP